MTGTEIAIVLAASLLGAFIKSITGMGYPLVAVPLITLAVGIDDAVVVVAAPNVVMNFLLLADARAARTETRDLSRLVGWGILGAAVGTFALVTVSERPLLVLLAATIAAFVVNYVRSPAFAIDRAIAHRWSPGVGFFAGVMQGAVGVSGPVVASWLHGYRLEKQAYVFSVTAIFGVTGVVQLTLLLAAGEMTADRAAVSALAFVPVLAMIPVGTRLRARLGGVAFERAVVAVLCGSGVALVIRVVTG